MICTISKHEAERKGYADALMLDWRGRVAEATGANVFFVKDGVIHTPTPDCFLDGITRRTVIDLAKRRGYQVVERAIMPEEMAAFEQCFLTGTAAEVTPVSEIGPYKFTVGEIAKTLMEDYSAEVQPKAPRHGRERVGDPTKKPPAARRLDQSSRTADCSAVSPRPARRSGRRLKLDRLRSLAALVRLGLEGDPLAVGQGAEAGALDRGDMDEHVLAAVVRRDEAVALRRIEEFHGAVLTHRMTFSVRFTDPDGCARRPGKQACQSRRKVGASEQSFGGP